MEGIHELTNEELSKISGGEYEAAPNVYLYSESELETLLPLAVKVYKKLYDNSYQFVNYGGFHGRDADGRFYAVIGTTHYNYDPYYFGPVDR